jgi:hypothetical protein
MLQLYGHDPRNELNDGSLFIADRRVGPRTMRTRRRARGHDVEAELR